MASEDIVADNEHAAACREQYDAMPPADRERLWKAAQTLCSDTVQRHIDAIAASLAPLGGPGSSGGPEEGGIDLVALKALRGHGERHSARGE